MSQLENKTSHPKLHAGMDIARDKGQPLREINPQEDPLTWCAVYQDETVLWECNPEGLILYTYADIQREALRYFRIYPTHVFLDYWAKRRASPEGQEITPPNPILVIELKENQRLIWRKRRRLQLQGAVKLPPIFLVGWQETVKVIEESGEVQERNFQAINYLYPTGVIILADRQSDIEIFEWETRVQKNVDEGE